jgi:hypothetical protein
MFRQRQRERKLDVFFFAKKAQDVRRAVVHGQAAPCLFSRQFLLSEKSLSAPEPEFAT